VIDRSHIQARSAAVAAAADVRVLITVVGLFLSVLALILKPGARLPVT
jgi:hypothetical protein